MLKRPRSRDFEVNFDGLRYRGQLNDLVDWNLFFFGSYSPQELDFLATAAWVLGGTTSGVTYFDVGANVGQHALFMSRRAAHVVAFEPSRLARERFAANIALNAIRNLLLFPIALGDVDSQGRLGSGFKGNSGSKSLTWTLAEHKDETVEIRRGDDLVRAEGLPRVDILKLDVEGYEKQALLGLRNTLLADRPVILMELVGKREKSGFRNEPELHASLYPEHELFTLPNCRKAKLIQFDWNSETMVCLPRERIKAFRAILPHPRKNRPVDQFRSDT
ncbi:MAG TPA: FkbM family methyltransferase [Stellaceae bacterium]|nr:FkbM family methyltransferase [Stellaceae bacterium]